MKSTVIHRFSTLRTATRTTLAITLTSVALASAGACSDSDTTPSHLSGDSLAATDSPMTTGDRTSGAVPTNPRQPTAPTAVPVTESTPAPADNPTDTDRECSAAGVLTDDVIAQVPPPMPGVRWVPTDSNLQTCSTLHYVILETEGGTVASPYQLMFFHDGEFLGTGTACDLAYQQVTGTTDDQVDVTYRYLVGDEPNAAPHGSVSVSYRWNGSGVDMVGALPAAVTHGRC